MNTEVSALDTEVQCLARKKRVVVHRSPPGDVWGVPGGYYVCDGNDFLLFPLRQLVGYGGATVEETREWLLKA